MDVIVKFINSDQVVALGIISSIISLIISTIVLINVKRIRKSYGFRARVPDLIEKLGTTASSISEQLDYFDGVTVKISETLSDAEVYLKSLKNKVRGQHRKNINILLAKIDRFNCIDKNVSSKIQRYFGNKSNISNDEKRIIIQGIYVDLYKITEESKTMLDDLQWEN